MTTAVVDASVIVAALLDSGDDGRWAEAQLLSFDLAAPHHVLMEASNVIRRAVLSKDVGVVEASLAHADLARFDLELFAFAPFSSRVWELRSNVTSHDAWYVAVAEALDCALLTLDRRLARASGTTCQFRVPSL